MHRLPLVWGATPEEAERAYPADLAVPAPTVLMTRAIDVAAPPERTWRWLTQLAVAPYSHDWLDNLGRRSPRELTPGVDRLELGQRMATVLRLVDLDPGHHWTGRTTPRGDLAFGPVAMTYAAEPVPAVSARAADRSRLVCRIAVGAGGRLGERVGRARAHALAWGDLVMIRTQLRTLRDLAERPSG